MDSMMFWPHSAGPLPPSAMADIEKKLAELQAGSHQIQWLELDRKPQVEKLQSAPASLPSSPPPDGSQERSIQVRRAETISRQQNSLMLKAARRSVVLPSLSISIPPSPHAEKPDRVRARDSEKGSERGSERGGGERETGTNAEPLHKQVKFLAPDEDGEMSDQSSICQSPSWEGYGQRKKEKKKEAERRKKEREQAEKEAKAAKKRQGTRLSKSPPPAGRGRTSKMATLANSDRSLSDPMLISQYLLPESQSSIGRLDDVGRAASADNLQMYRNQQPAMAEVLSSSNPHSPQFVGGVKLETERDIALQYQLGARGQQPPSFPNYSMSDDSGYYYSQQSPPLEKPATARQDGRAPREAFPPSASRTPMLRQMPPPPLQRNNSLLQGASKIFRGRDGRASGEAESERGRHRGGYVQRAREQSIERSVAELAYEQLINNGHQSSSTRSSSRDTRHTRRSSFTQEAKSVAMKLAGMKQSTPSGRDGLESGRASSQTDYFNHSAEHPNAYGAPQPHHPLDTARHESYRNHLAEEQLAMSEAALSRGTLALRDGERPSTSQSSAKSSSPSVAGYSTGQHGKKGRSLRDVAKAALGTSRNGHSIQDNTHSQILAVPYSTLRSQVESSIQTPETNSPLRSPISTSPNATTVQEQNSRVAQPTSTETLVPNSIRPADVDPGVSRVSEGSSSSSAYEDGSPPPSPITTPDTSRPQSSKDVPFAVGEVAKKTDESQHAQDDDATLRQVSEGSNGSSTSTTPRQVNSEASAHADLPNEDRFSRTAVPLDIDCDAQSFTTSFSNLDNIDNIDETLANAAAAAQQSRHQGAEEDRDVRQPKRLRSLSDTNYRSGRIDSMTVPASFAQFEVGLPSENNLLIPPRSKKREAGRPSTSHGEKSPTQPRHENAVEDGHQTPEPEWGVVKTGKGSVRDTADYSRSADRVVVSNAEVMEPAEPVRLAPTKETSFLVSQGSTPEQLSPTYPQQVREQAAHREPVEMQIPGSRASSRAASTSPPSPQSPKFPRVDSPTVKHAHRTHPPHQVAPSSNTASRPGSAASSSRLTTSAPIPTTRPASATPVSILKQPARSSPDSAATLPTNGSRPPVLSALPKHMQLQAGIPARPPVAATESRMAPIAKMFVECCNCKFYHDMPSKLYECMAKPDAVVEDKLLGISGAITTMVKCPWCHHNMSTSCCAGYAAVVYLKEKLH